MFTGQTLVPGIVAGCLSLALPVLSFTSYSNDFADPKYILSKKFPATTVEAQRTILAWADEFASLGPWGAHRILPQRSCLTDGI